MSALEYLEKLVRTRKTYVFVVDKYSWPIHASRSFSAVKYPRRKGGFSGLYGIYADLKGLREGDLVFFYQRRVDEPPQERGFRGIYEVAGAPLIDTSDVGLQGYRYRILGKCPYCGALFPEKNETRGRREVWKCGECDREIPLGNHILPIRVKLKPVMYFKTPVDDNSAYVDRRYEGGIWTLLFRKVYGPGRERSVNPILPEEALRLVRIMVDINKGQFDRLPPNYNQYDPKPGQLIDLGLCNQLGQVRYEHQLIGWIMENIDKGTDQTLRELVPPGELEWFGNEVIYGIGGEKVDILCLHREGKEGPRYKATVFEVKRDRIDESTLQQIKRYSYWVAQLVTANEPSVSSLTIQPVIIGYTVSTMVRSEVRSWRIERFLIEYPGRTVNITVEKPILLTYRVYNCTVSFSER